jgi:L-2-hydroxycarboxylate dehydrogenase (NAD+)
MSDQISHRIPLEKLKDYTIKCFQLAGVCEPDARVTTDILLAADLRGISSHGVAHLKRYVDGLSSGTINARPQEQLLASSPATATIDAGAGLGPPVSNRAMRQAIDKAREVGAGFVAVRNSNHFGIAGYYAMMALEYDCIGLAMTNASPKAVPTFGRNAILGTNPIAVAAPAGNARPFVLDMATTTVSQGKIEVADQLDKAIPAGWAIDQYEAPFVDAHRALEEFRRNVGGGLLPLGGEGDLFSGYKGYGLALWVEVFSALLSGAAFATYTYPRSSEGKSLPANVGHFFGAWRIDSFRPAEEFKAAMDDLQALIKAAPKAEGRERIYIHGEKEIEAMEQNLREGIPLNAKVLTELSALGRQLGIESDF